MKYDVIFKCGHEERIELFGKTSERERKIEYFQNCCICSECRRKAIAESRKEEDEANGIKTPEILSGGKWNGKIYGYGAIKSIYLNGNKVELTPEELEELENYKKAIENLNN